MKRPAVVLRTEPYRVLAPNTSELPLEVWTDSKYALITRLRKAERRGEVATVSDWRPMPHRPGWYSVDVRRLRRPAPAWKLPMFAGACGLALVGMTWWALGVLVGAVIANAAMIVGGLAIGVITLAAVKAFSGGGSISVTQIVNIWR